MKWIRFLLGLCNHRWEIKDEIQLTLGGKTVGERYILRCKECGHLKKRDLY
jgi:hypothetical protein